jgi:hypothetical protein
VKLAEVRITVFVMDLDLQRGRITLAFALPLLPAKHHRRRRGVDLDVVVERKRRQQRLGAAVK